MIHIRFAGEWSGWLALTVGVVGAIGISVLYWRESKTTENPYRWLLPLLRSVSFVMLVFMLAGPTLYQRRFEGELSRVSVVLDLSTSMNTREEPDAANRASRIGSVDPSDRKIDRVLKWMVGNEDRPEERLSWMQRIRSQHRIDWYSTGAAENGDVDTNKSRVLNRLWNSQSGRELPRANSINAVASTSPLADALIAARGESPAAIVFISDGQSNVGPSLGDVVRLSEASRAPVFTIGVGSMQEPNDLGVIGVEHSERVFRTDLLRGTVTLKERMPIGTSYEVRLEQQGTVVWTKKLTSQDLGVRRLEFELPADALVDQSKRSQKIGLDFSAVPIDLRVSIHSKAREISLQNNDVRTSLWGVDRRSRVLLLDRRGGWETRYIKNAFQRDVVWEVQAAIGRTALSGEFFPSSRAKLFEYDLLILSQDTIASLNEEQRTWVIDFVGVSGGGLILIGNPRDERSEATFKMLAPLMPVRPLVTQPSPTITSLRLSPAGSEQTALEISSTPEENRQLWGQLQPPRSMLCVAIEPGAECLVEAAFGSGQRTETYPFIATKLFGQGRVLYLSSDETWRWRYLVADLHHQRFWNQVASWVMRAPFAINDNFVSLDTGHRTITTGDSVTIRSRLKQADSQPLVNAQVQAIVFRNGERFSTVPLSEEPDSRGFYRTTTGPFPAGEYQVRLEAVEIPNDALTVQSEFVVQMPIDLEMETLACNVEGLEQLSAQTGGVFVMFEEAESITQHLKSYETGKVVESQFAMWQSYPWFVTIVGLLAVEWYIRKRAGLV